MIRIGQDLLLPEKELEFRFIHASGPGGQNVNKVATAVQLRFDVLRSPSLSAAMKTRLARLAGRRINDQGILTLRASRYRSQAQNRKDAITRLTQLIRRAALGSKPRIRTQASRAVRQKRLANKQQRSKIKNLRRSVSRSFEE